MSQDNVSPKSGRAGRAPGPEAAPQVRREVRVPPAEPGTARVAARPSPPAARLEFERGWRTERDGRIHQGGRLTIAYDPERLPHCRQTWRGAVAWGIAAHVRFHPSGQRFDGSLVAANATGFGPALAVPVPLDLKVPLDATHVEMWFQNHSGVSSACDAWDSRFGRNYWFEILPWGPARQVNRRQGAISAPEMVNVYAEDAAWIRGAVQGMGTRAGRRDASVSHVFLKAWVRNVAYEKNVWFDFHLFDAADELVHAETRALRYLEPARGDGDFFSIDDLVVEDAGREGPGGAALDRRPVMVQYRLYYEVSGRVYTDNLLHQVQVVRESEGH